jgi:hypothetical protein
MRAAYPVIGRPSVLIGRTSLLIGPGWLAN